MCLRSSSATTDKQAAFVAERITFGLACPAGPLPPCRTQTPAVTRFQAGKSIFGGSLIIPAALLKLRNSFVITAHTVWLPRSSGLVWQQPSRKKPVIGATEQGISRRQAHFSGVHRNFHHPCILPLVFTQWLSRVFSCSI